jgi:hypothetical protein
MLPGVNPAKSLPSQPLVELGTGVGGMVMSTGWTAAWASPPPEYCRVKKPAGSFGV